MEHVESLFSLCGKTALVTGGSSGLGLHIAEAFLRAGARVLIVSRRSEACGQAVAQLSALKLPGAVEGFGGDVADSSGIEAIVDAVRQRTDTLSILVNAAGKAWGGTLESFPRKAWQDVMAVNVDGGFNLIQKVLPFLRRAASAHDPARIVNLGSISGSLPVGTGAYSYAASKAAVHHLTRILARELAREHITVNAVAPGVFHSRMTNFGLRDEEQRGRIASKIPLGRLGERDDIAAALLFLCGRGGAYVTGAVLPVDGGMSVDGGINVWEAEPA